MASAQVKVGDWVRWSKLEINDKDCRLQVAYLDEGPDSAMLRLTYKNEIAEEYSAAVDTIRRIFGRVLDTSHHKTHIWYGPRFAQEPEWDKFWFKTIARIGPIPISELEVLGSGYGS